MDLQGPSNLLRFKKNGGRPDAFREINLILFTIAAIWTCYYIVGNYSLG